MFDKIRIMINCESFFLGMCIANGVFGANTGKIKSVSIMEGDSVTLNSNIKIQSNDQILWMFGAQETCIAQIYKQSIDMPESNVTFGDRLKIDSQTGSLTIRNITTKHSGSYKLTIIRSGTSYITFTVTVYGLPTPLISRKSASIKAPSSSSIPKCMLDCSVFNISNVSLSWYKGNSLFSTIRVSDLNNSIYLHLECLNDSYSCVVAYSFTNKTTHLNNMEHCHTCSEVPKRSHLILLMATVVLLVLVIFAIFCRKSKRMGRTVKIQEEEMHYTEAMFCTQPLQRTDYNAEDHTVYSSIRT